MGAPALCARAPSRGVVTEGNKELFVKVAVVSAPFPGKLKATGPNAEFMFLGISLVILIALGVDGIGDGEAIEDQPLIEILLLRGSKRPGAGRSDRVLRRRT